MRLEIENYDKDSMLSTKPTVRIILNFGGRGFSTELKKYKVSSFTQ